MNLLSANPHVPLDFPQPFMGQEAITPVNPELELGVKILIAIKE
jgi:hypothetical protein